MCSRVRRRVVLIFTGRRAFRMKPKPRSSVYLCMQICARIHRDNFVSAIAGCGFNTSENCDVNVAQILDGLLRK